MNPFKVALMAGVLAFTWNCSDDSSSSPSEPDSSASSVALPSLNPDATLVYESPIGSIFSDMTVRDAAGNLIGVFDGTNIILLDGTVIDVNGNVISAPTSSESISISSESGILPSSAATGASSASVEPLSSAQVEAASSSSTADLTGSGTMDPSGYEVPILNTLLNNGATGWSSRYWDACKPHCSWPENVDTSSLEIFKKNYGAAKNCNIHDYEIPAWTLSENVQEYWKGFQGTNSACTNGKSGAFACTDMAPVAVNDTLAYAFVAAPGSGNQGCGKCYHLQFNGGNHDNNIKATHKALKGKHMIVMASNIGYDVEKGQFDMMVPGGGVGLYDALSTMVNASNVEWGAQYGGFLSHCQQSLGYDASVAAYQSCVKDMCAAAFTGYDNLLRGCEWFADWYMAADNPTYNWEEIECPQYLIDKYSSSFNTQIETDFAWQDDWSSYTGGELPTKECSDTGCP